MKKLKYFLTNILLMIFLVSCSLPGLGGNVKNEVVIASGNNLERQVLAEYTAQMIEHYTDLKTTQINNLGSSTLIFRAFENGDINVSAAMYTGTSLTGELAMDPITDPKKAMDVVQKEYKKRFNRTWFNSYGFDNTYAFMVTKDFAKKHDLKKVSDLEKLEKELGLSVGVDMGWIDRPGDGYKAFKEKYGFSFDNMYPMEIGLVYSALNSNNMDVVLGYSTDGRINAYDLVILEDDKELFPAYDCSAVVDDEILKTYPELKDVFKKMENTIDNETMQLLNRKASEELTETNIIVEDFLKEHNYFEGDSK